MIPETTTDTDVPLPQILLRLSQHLSLLAAHAKALDTDGDTATNDGTTLPDYVIKRLQGIDFLRQSLDDLCILTFLLGSEEKTPYLTQTQAQAAASQLRLSATRMLLDVGPFSAPVTSQDASGEPEFF